MFSLVEPIVEPMVPSRPLHLCHPFYETWSTSNSLCLSYRPRYKTRVSCETWGVAGCHFQNQTPVKTVAFLAALFKGEALALVSCRSSYNPSLMVVGSVSPSFTNCLITQQIKVMMSLNEPLLPHPFLRLSGNLSHPHRSFTWPREKKKHFL